MRKTSKDKAHTAKALIALLEQFAPLHSHSDEVWRFCLPASSGKKWHRLHAQKVYGRVYLSDHQQQTCYPPEREGGDTEVVEELAQKWIPLLKQWRERVEQDPIVAQSELAARLPVDLRTGLLLRRNAMRALPQLNLAQHFSQRDLRDLTKILLARPRERIPKMSSEDYFAYCKVAYEANAKTFTQASFRHFKKQTFKKQSSGRVYYKSYADGRDGGLLALEPKSQSAFEEWYHSKQWQGCHPWEIYRGGNSTHINLGVEHDQRGWEVSLTAYSSTRMVETRRIAIALHRAQLPCTVHHAESYLLRLRGEDWVGIVPKDDPIAYAWQSFPREYSVADVIHFGWLTETLPAQKRAQVRRQYAKLTNWFIAPISGWLRKA
jgi:hypothetical protein